MASVVCWRGLCKTLADLVRAASFVSPALQHQRTSALGQWGRPGGTGRTGKRFRPRADREGSNSTRVGCEACISSCVSICFDLLRCSLLCLGVLPVGLSSER